MTSSIITISLFDSIAPKILIYHGDCKSVCECRYIEREHTDAHAQSLRHKVTPSGHDRGISTEQRVLGKWHPLPHPHLLSVPVHRSHWPTQTSSVQSSNTKSKGGKHTGGREDAVAWPGVITVEVITSVPIVVTMVLVTEMLLGRISDPLKRCPCSKTCR